LISITRQPRLSAQVATLADVIMSTKLAQTGRQGASELKYYKQYNHLSISIILMV